MEQRGDTAQGIRLDEAVGNITACLMSNHANTLSLVACLSVCTETMPYREAEDIIAMLPELGSSMQNAHTLVGLLVDCGGIETIEVPEDGNSEGEQQDQPCDHLLRTTEAGRRVLESFDPVKRFTDLLDGEPETYPQAYASILSLCVDGAQKADIEQALSGDIALTDPVRVYPSYFISKLETVGGLTWDGVWKTTEDGRCMLASIG